MLPQLLLGLAAAAALYVWFTLPPRAARLAPMPADPRIVYGAYHVHTNRSDGTGSPDSIAEAAARAGLKFVILTDHGDATRPPDPPQYRHGVLTIDAVEISTTAGHLVALGLNTPAPYPLAGEPRDVIEDVHRLGGWTIISHPDSPKPDLRWRNWNVRADGIEWLNFDSEWRDETATHLAGTVARYFVRPPETIASLVRRPVPTLRRWDMIARNRPVVALAALDAHARLPWRASQGQSQDGTLAAIPSYRQMFKTSSQAVVLDRPLSGNAADDATRLLTALRTGRTFSVLTAIAAPGSLDFTATQNDHIARMGDLAGTSGSAAFHARVNDPSARLSLVHDGAEIASGRGQLDFTGAVTRGPYRIEAYRPGVAVPWIVSNPIYGADPGDMEVATLRRPPAPVRLVSLPASGGWAIERSDTSTATFAPVGETTRFSFALGPGAPSNQFAALGAGLDAALAQEGFDRVQFTARADRPTRFSVQLRLPAGQRWRYSVYADESPRDVVAYLEDFEPAERGTSHRPIVARLRSVLFVVDTLNAAPDTRGSIWLSNVALGVGRAER